MWTMWLCVEEKSRVDKAPPIFPIQNLSFTASSSYLKSGIFPAQFVPPNRIWYFWRQQTPPELIHKPLRWGNLNTLPSAQTAQTLLVFNDFSERTNSWAAVFPASKFDLPINWLLITGNLPRAEFFSRTVSHFLIFRTDYQRIALNRTTSIPWK